MRLIPAMTVMAIILPAGPTSAASPGAISLQKVGAWQMNYDADSCHLLAKFGTGDQTVSMKITRIAPGDFFDLTLYGEAFFSHFPRVAVAITFGDQHSSLKRGAMAGTVVGPQKLPLFFISSLRIDTKGEGPSPKLPIPQVLPEDEAATQFITVSIGGQRTMRLETGSLGAPFKALRACTRDLVKSWGYDPDVQERLSRQPRLINDNTSLLKSTDYPTLAANRGDSGALGIRLDVEETGHVSGCRVLYRSDPDLFADLTCKLLLQRVKMTPALDENGKPVKSYYVRNVSWLSD